MELTVGTALQGGKYVIREVLSQSDVEITYRATHAYLDQPVLLRSLQPTAQQRDDFAQVKQRFVAHVRSQVKQSTPATAPVLDCFEEGNLPFVVLQFKLEQTSPLPSPQAASVVPPIPQTEPKNQAAFKPTIPQANIEDTPTQIAPQPDLLQAFDAALDGNAEPHLPGSDSIVPDSIVPDSTKMNAPESSQPSSSQQSTESDYEPIIFHPSLEPAVASASNGHSKTMSIGTARSSPLRQKMPIALLAVALVGGCIGAGTGLALRLDTAHSQPGETKPRLSLFHREQSFPSEGNWPIQEHYSPEPLIEQPLYRATPSPERDPSAINPSATIPPLSTEPVPTPAPSVEAPKPLPQEFELPADPPLPPVEPQPKLPNQAVPLPGSGSTGETPPRVDRLPPISPDNLLPPTTVTPAPIPPPSDQSIETPPLLKSLPDSSGI